MPINNVIDEKYTSSAPGAYANGMVTASTLPLWEEGYADVGTTLAAVGQLVVKQAAAANTGGANAQVSAVANQALLGGEYGIVVKAAPSTQSPTGVMCQRGVVTALCTTGATAIAVGTLLSADGAGNLTPAPTTPTPGQILARSYGTLAATTATPTSVLVLVGNA